MTRPPSWHCVCYCVRVCDRERECVTCESCSTRDGFGKWHEWMRHEWRSQGVRETWHLIIQVWLCVSVCVYVCVCVFKLGLRAGGSGMPDVSWIQQKHTSTPTNPLANMFVHILIFSMIPKCRCMVRMMLTAALFGISIFCLWKHLETWASCSICTLYLVAVCSVYM